MDEPMTQWRAIPIEWLMSDDKYHKFLMWVSGKATFNGWGRCDALQVTFTSREAALKFGVAPSTITAWTNRAKEAGLLLPTNSFSRERGAGEVYGLGGELRMAVTQTPESAEQGRSKDRARPEQRSTMQTDVCVVPESKDRASVEQASSVNRNTPDTPDTPKKKRRSIREKLDLLEGYHPSAELVVRELIPVWPTEAGERTIKSDPYLAAARLTEIFSEYPTLDPQLLIGAALRYRNNLQEANELQYLSGLQFFFGPGKAGKTPKWKDEVRALRHEQKLENA